jgi:hypothetical protein
MESRRRATRASPAVVQADSAGASDPTKSSSTPPVDPNTIEKEAIDEEENVKSEEESDDDSQLSDVDEDDVEEDEDAADELGGTDADNDQATICEELVPVRLDLKSADWEFRDQFEWPVTFPLDMFGNTCNDYLEYNLKDPRIDTFALRTVEDLDFPVGFDVAIAKSIRAQLLSTIPVLWKEKQLNAIQERRNQIAQRRKTGVRTLTSTNAMDVTPTALSSDGKNQEDRSKEGPKDHTSEAATDSKGAKQPNARQKDLGFRNREEMLTAITKSDVYPANAVKRLFKSANQGVDEDEEGRRAREDQEMRELEEAEEDSSDFATIKKRRKSLGESLDGISSTGGSGAGETRKKRKRGTAFEAHSLVDERIVIKLNIAMCGVLLQDQFYWDPVTPLFWCEIFARRLATELGLPREMEIAIAFEIRRQVLGYLASSSQLLPADWTGTIGSSSKLAASTGSSSHPSSSSIGSSSSTSGVASINLTGGPNTTSSSTGSTTTIAASGSSLTSSSGTLPKSGGRSGLHASRGAGEQSYIPTRSLPILSLRNAIRAPSSSDAYAPSLTFHGPSQAKWERELALQKARQPRAAHPPSTTVPAQNTAAPVHGTAAHHTHGPSPHMPHIGSSYAGSGAHKAPTFAPGMQRPAPIR